MQLAETQAAARLLSAGTSEHPFAPSSASISLLCLSSPPASLQAPQESLLWKSLSGPQHPPWAAHPPAKPSGFLQPHPSFLLPQKLPYPFLGSTDAHVGLHQLVYSPDPTQEGV